MKHYLIYDREGQIIGKVSTNKIVPPPMKWVTLSWIKRYCVFHQTKFGINPYDARFVEVNSKEFSRN